MPGAPETNIYLSLREDYVVLEILEGNTNFIKENFEVEVFFESEMSGTVTAPPSTLEQMAFLNNAISVPKPLGNAETNIGNVEYYFNLYLDQEIPADILQEAKIDMNDLTSNSTRPRFNRDLYINPEDEEAC